MLKDKVLRKEYNKRYYQNNKESISLKQKEYKKEWKKINPDYSRNYYKIWQRDNREKCRLATRKHYEKDKIMNPERYSLKDKKKYHKRKDSWIAYFPEQTNCEICEKPIFFKNHPRHETICFDHKNENPIIKEPPSSWLQKRLRNNKNEKTWESCNFGMLCARCNLGLPTKNRKQWLEKVIKYVNKD